MRVLSILVGCAVLVACGTKGPLVLPPRHIPEAAPAGAPPSATQRSSGQTDDNKTPAKAGP